MTDPAAITQLIDAFRGGDRAAFDQLVAAVYDDLITLARRQLRRVGGNETLATTGLVHEAYLRLAEQTRAEWQDRGHFFAVAATAMRQIAISYARRHRAAKRGGGQARVTFDENVLAVEEQAAELLALDQALERLRGLDERLVRVVECRYFAGLDEEETAAALGVSRRTVQRDWVRARAWLAEALGADVGESESGGGEGRA